jgi:four helix bundle protein
MTGDRRPETGAKDRTEEMIDRGRETRGMTYKFQELEIYKLSLDYLDRLYELGRQLPEAERFNLRDQLQRAATSIVLNIAEGSTGLTDLEQKRFILMATRSYLETIACLDILEKRNFFQDQQLTAIRELGHRLFIKLQAFKKALKI